MGSLRVQVAALGAILSDGIAAVAHLAFEVYGALAGLLALDLADLAERAALGFAVPFALPHPPLPG
jgi:hypothetical protein